MNYAYVIPLCVSGLVHGLVLYGITCTIAVEMPALYVEEAPSALEITICSLNAAQPSLHAEEKTLPVSEQTKEALVEEIQAVHSEATFLSAPEVSPAPHNVSGSEGVIDEELSEQDAASEKDASVAAFPFPNIRVGSSSREYDPLPIVNPSPKYPRSARARGEEGMVILDMVIETNGRVSAVTIVTTSGYAALDTAAVEAVRRWRFEPARNVMKCLSIRRKMPIVFKLK